MESVDSHLLIRHAANAGTFAVELLGWTPDPKQMLVLESTARRVVLNCSRQWGKTTVTATKVVHLAVTRPGMGALIVCENLGQTGEFFAKIDAFLGRLGIGVRGEPGKRMGRRLGNGSRIVGIAAREAAVRGYTADFVFLDEAARIPDEVIDAFAPVIAVRKGDWWMASTPRGKRGRFWEAWAYGEGADLLKVSAKGSECSRIGPEFIERMRLEKGDAYVRQEFECEFVENGVHLLDLDSVDGLVVK
ncbi:MAG TPA: terminase family protein [Bryobacteraceae bacterium]|jgi:hypothetical protein